VIDMGISRYSHLDVARILRKHFLPGTYDILLKNCNSFTDCALYMMCEQRLAWHFRGLDTIGRTVDANGLLRSLLPDRYRPNPLCADWQLEDVIGQIDSEFPFPLGVITADEVDDGYVVCDIDDEGSGSSDREGPESSGFELDFMNLFDHGEFEVDPAAHVAVGHGWWWTLFDLDSFDPDEHHSEGSDDWRAVFAPHVDLRVSNPLSCKPNTGYTQPLRGDPDSGCQFDESDSDGLSEFL